MSAGSEQPGRRVQWRLLLWGVWLLGSVAAAWLVVATRRPCVELRLEFDPRSVGLLTNAAGADRPRAFDEFLETQAVIMTSRALCASVVDALQGIGHGFSVEGDSERERAAQEVCAGIAVERIGASLVLSLRYQDGDALRARLVADTLAARYVQRALALRAEQRKLPQWAEELETRAQVRRQHEEALAAFTRTHQVTSLDAEEALAASSLRSYTEALTQTRIRRVRLNAQVAQLEATQTKGGDENTALPGADLGLLRNRIADKQRELEVAIASSDGHHPRVNALRLERDSLNGQYAREIRIAVDAVRDELTTAEREERELDRSIQQTRAAALRIEELKLEFNKLQREATRDDFLTDAIAGQVETVRRNASEQGWLVRVLTPAYKVEPVLLLQVLVPSCALVALSALALALARFAPGIGR